MLYTGGVAVAVKTATTGIGAKMAADTLLSPTDRAFAAEYTTKLATVNTSYEEDSRFKFVFDQWWIANMKKQTGSL
jgi:hypothetical protein